MTLYSHLTVQQFNDQLAHEMRNDAASLLHLKSDLVKVESLIEHTPVTFLKARPLIVVYSILKPMGL